VSLRRFQGPLLAVVLTCARFTQLDQLFEARISARRFGNHRLNAPLEGETHSVDGKLSKSEMADAERHLE